MTILQKRYATHISRKYFVIFFRMQFSTISFIKLVSRLDTRSASLPRRPL